MVSRSREGNTYHRSKFNGASDRLCRLGRGSVGLGVGFMGCVEGLCTFAHRGVEEP